MVQDMKILFLDIETSPNLAHVWGLWQQNVAINQLVNSTEVICFGARWYGQRKVHFSSVHHDGKAEMLKAIHELLDEADAVVGWNSAAFDMKHLRREFIENDMLPPSPSKDIDLMKVARQQFKFPSNKLDYVAQKLGVGKKVKHSGFDLWIGAMAGDEKSWREMKKYQIQDVNLLVDLYEKFLPWIKIHPNRAFDLEACTNCGSTHLQARGLARTTAAVYQRYQCQGCGKWLRGTKALVGSKIRPEN
jgi:DNA polymerase elongation subunit (family B)